MGIINLKEALKEKKASLEKAKRIVETSEKAFSEAQNNLVREEVSAVLAEVGLHEMISELKITSSENMSVSTIQCDGFTLEFRRFHKEYSVSIFTLRDGWFKSSKKNYLDSFVDTYWKFNCFQSEVHRQFEAQATRLLEINTQLKSVWDHVPDPYKKRKMQS